LNPARLPPDLCQFSRVFDLLHVVAQLARTSRGKAYSSLILPLEEPHSGAPKQWQESKPPPAIYIECDQRRQDGEAEEELDQAGPQPLAPFSRADIGNTNIPSFHLVNERQNEAPIGNEGCQDQRIFILTSFLVSVNALPLQSLQ
jgi:hypothetical protein